MRVALLYPEVYDMARFKESARSSRHSASYTWRRSSSRPVTSSRSRP